MQLMDIALNTEMYCVASCDKYLQGNEDSWNVLH